ncbi:hypothetical protein FCV25MIE_22076 [Fagus crenata]
MARASKALCETSTKPLVLSLFLALLLIVTLFDHPTEFSVITKSHSSSARRLLLHPPTTQKFTTEFHPKQSKNATKRQYGAAKHEVPSGPNPESNK